MPSKRVRTEEQPKSAAARRFAPPPFDHALMVGRVEPRAARLWLRLAHRGRHRVVLTAVDSASHAADIDLQPDGQRDGTASLWLPHDVPGLPAMRPATRYELAVHRCADGRSIGAARFETPPEPGAARRDPVAIGVMSCYQPFDADGRVSERARSMLRNARAVLRRHDAKLLLAIGDQIYADQPQRLAMLGSAARLQPRPPKGFAGLDARTMRRLFQRRYRTLWNVPEWCDLHADQPVLPILDDHDVANNFGSDPAHGSREWAPVRQGALAAYFDYQATRERDPAATLPESFHYRWRWGPLAGFATDFRTPRHSAGTPRLCNDAQLDDLARWLEEEADAGALVVSTGVPLVHVPRAAARLLGGVLPAGNDFVDRIDHPRYDRDRGRIVELLLTQRRRRPQQPLIVLGGDIHIGALQRLQPRDGSATFHELISSAICNRPPLWQRLLSATFLSRVRRLRDGAGRPAVDIRLVTQSEARRNPYLGCNLGLIELDPRTDPARVTLSLWGQRHGEPLCALRTTTTR